MEQKIFNEYAALVEMLLSGVEPSLDFASACAQIGADPDLLETVVGEELGYCGDELIEVFRNNRFS